MRITMAAIEIYPAYLTDQKYFVYRLVEDQTCSFTFLKAFLVAYRPFADRFVDGPLVELDLQAIEASHLTQAFFGEFNASIGMDYLTAFQASRQQGKPNVEYLQRSLDYLYKATRENN